LCRDRRGWSREGWLGLGVRGLSRAFIQAFLSLMTPVILLGGIYSGVFTPTGAGAAVALYAMILAALRLPGVILSGFFYKAGRASKRVRPPHLLGGFPCCAAAGDTNPERLEWDPC